MTGLRLFMFRARGRVRAAMARAMLTTEVSEHTFTQVFSLGQKEMDLESLSQYSRYYTTAGESTVLPFYERQANVGTEERLIS